MKRCVFCHFPARIAKFNNVLWSFVSKFQKNGRICGFHWTFRSKRCFSFRGASPPPDLPTTGSAPGPHWGLGPQTPVICSCSARSPWSPLCQILNTPLCTNYPDLEPGNEFWNRVLVPGSWYKSLSHRPISCLVICIRAFVDCLPWYHQSPSSVFLIVCAHMKQCVEDMHDVKLILTDHLIDLLIH